MTILISFKTSKFDTTNERPNPINPIAGESVLFWLREDVLLAPYDCTIPDEEDWGWYIDVTSPDGRYMVGSNALTDEDTTAGDEVEWLIQIHKYRSLKEKLLGQNKLDSRDPLVQQIAGSLRNDEAFDDVEEEEAP